MTDTLGEFASIDATEPGISLTIRILPHPTEIFSIELTTSLPDGAPCPLQILEAVGTVIQRQLALSYGISTLQQYGSLLQQQQIQQQTGLVVPSNQQPVPRNLRRHP